MEEDNGILARVPGQFVADSIAMLPDPDTAEDRPYEVVIDADYVGTVRLFARRQYTQHGRFGRWFWVVYRAEPAE